MLTLILILIPLAAALITLLGKGSGAKLVALGGSIAALVVTLFIWQKFDPTGGTQFAFRYPWLESLGISFSGGIDGISLLLVFLTTFLTPFIILSGFGQQYKNESTFYALILFMESALIGVFVATDAFLFYLFFEAALIPVYFLSAVWGGPNRRPVTFKFFVYTMFGSFFMLVALIYLYFQTPGYHSSDINAFYNLGLSTGAQSLVFLAFFLAFGIKMPIFPLHTWQPDTYVESPTPATMLLSGIMLKMGVYGMVRFLLPITPLGLEKWGHLAIILAVIGIVYGSVIAIQQRDMKRLIAYSSLAHVCLMGAGIFSANTQGLQGAMIQSLSHGINVVGLFFIIEIIQSRTQSRFLSELGGITQKAPLLSTLFMIILLGSVALPLTNGFVGEFLLLAGVFQYNNWLGAVAGLTIILAAVYMLRLYQKAIFGQQSELTTHFSDLNATERMVLVPLALMVIWIGVYPNMFLKITEPAVTHILQVVSAP